MNPKACSEVYAIIKVMDQNTTKKIPQRLLDFIKVNRDVFYNPEFKTVPKNFDNLEHDTKVMFAMIYKKYFKNIDVNYSENEKEKIVVEEVKEENKTEQLALETYKDSIFTRVKKWLLNIKEKIFK